MRSRWARTATFWVFLDADGTGRHYLDLPSELEVDAAGPVSVDIDMFHDSDEDEVA